MTTEFEALCARHPGWTCTGTELVRTWDCRDAEEAVRLLQRIIALSMEQDHHPELTWTYRRIHLRLTTHEEGGLGPRDVRWVEALERTGG
ncbi:MAG: 4a-hydroxytetrahydrobiopterin dehydratase [Candidatus Sericytochromatia bacterium]|nr:4a-hydroxytetrahydrobiopterin dehydratase [Candidatus Tanganyikabacteria bacterium]